MVLNQAWFVARVSHSIVRVGTTHAVGSLPQLRTAIRSTCALLSWVLRFLRLAVTWGRDDPRYGAGAALERGRPFYRPAIVL